ncbi:DUF6978 family protein [Staphylococcus aureus]
MLRSNNYISNMIRFDVNGSDHANPPNNERIPTPHIHIYTEEYNNGGESSTLNWTNSMRIDIVNLRK